MIDRLEIQKQMRDLEDSSLRRLVFLKQTDYLPEAVEIARDELARRGMSVLTPEEYWLQYQDEWLETVGFCYRCWAETTDESVGHTMTVNFIGQRLLGEENPCELCGSVVQTKWFCIVLPLVPIGKYRVIRIKHGPYIGRKMKPDESETKQS